jgi:hypothetical protein
MADGAVRRLNAPRDLRNRHERRLGGLYVRCEGSREAGWIDENKAILRREETVPANG